MIKNKIYYMLLGLGLGIIISSSLNIVFNKTETVEYTDEQIKEKAKNLGMISIKENIENNDKEKIKKDKEDIKEEVAEPEVNESEETYSEIKQEPKEIKTEPKVETPPQQPQNTQVQYKSIVINELDTANDIINELVNNGIVEDRQELRRVVTQNKLQTKFISGTYNLRQKSSTEETLRKLIKEKELKSVDFK